MFDEKVWVRLAYVIIRVTLTLTLTTVYRYRHLTGRNTKCKFLGKMSTEERIRFAMWTGNDYLPGGR